MKEERVRRMMAGESRRLNGAGVGIPARLMDFPLPEGRSKYPFFGGNPLANALFAVFSAIFPPGERFFVESVRRFRDRIGDETLQAEVSGFIGQEAIHGREHEHLNEWFCANGYDIAMADRMIRVSLGMLERLPASQQAACTSFMEHVTAHLAEQWLTHEEFRSTTDPEMIRLWTWHAIEELEHKSVVFDVHAQISRHPWIERVLAAPLVLGALLPGIAFSWVWITYRQGEALNVREHRRGLKALLGRGGFIRKVLVRMPEYFHRDFHPERQDTRALEQQWRERLFGEDGELNDVFTNRDAVTKASGPRRSVSAH